jgi:hypothetical protein
MFPWVGLVPAAVASAFGAGARAPSRVRTWLGAWALLAFALVSSMLTKFHHYVLPAVPPLAMLVGLEIDDALDRGALTHARRPLAIVAALGGALLVIAVGADLVVRDTTGNVVGAARLLHLFTYQYHRAWPDGLDFRAPLVAVTALAALGTIAFGIAPRFRRGTPLVVLAVAGALFAVWSLDFYLVACAPHWGQREIAVAFRRTGDEEPLVAYQMNWKGENFYTGNRLAIFVSSGAPFLQYLRTRAAARTVHFVTEHSRIAALRAELAGDKAFALERLTPLTTAEEDNKFVLLAATRAVP